MMFFVYFIYEEFKLFLWFGPYHKNIVDEVEIVAGFVFNESMDMFAYVGTHIVRIAQPLIWGKNLS